MAELRWHEARGTAPAISVNPCDWTAGEAASAIKRGEVTAEELATALLARCGALASLNAFITLDRERVLAEARRADRRRADGEPLGPLHGVPLAIKDNIDSAGYPTTAGTPALRDHRPTRTAPVVQALLDAGAIVLGKTNLQELAYGVTSNNPTFGAVGNPYDPTHIPGGSSGGTAAAVAARMAPAGLGSDTAGSVRIPAAHCGIVGFRPTTGRYPQDGIVPLSHTRDTAGPMARTVADVALLDHVITGSALPRPAELRGLRLGIPRRHFYEGIDPTVLAAVEQELARVHDLGVELVDAELPGRRKTSMAIAAAITAWEFPRDLAAYLGQTASPLSANDVLRAIATPHLKRDAGRFVLLGPAAWPFYQRAVTTARPALQSAFEACFAADRLDAVAFPTVPLPATPIRDDETIDHQGERSPARKVLLRNTILASLASAPGISLPIARSPEGLPIAIELDAPAGRDADLLAIALAWERSATPIPPPPL